MSDESIKPPPTSDNSLTPLIDYYSYNIRVKLNGSISRQPKVTYTREKTVNIYIFYGLAGSSSHSNDSMLQTVYLVRLHYQKMLTSISMDILATELVLIDISGRWVRSKCINFWSRYGFFCSY